MRGGGRRHFRRKVRGRLLLGLSRVGGALDVLCAELGSDEGCFGALGGLRAFEDADPLANGIDEDGGNEDEEDGADAGVELIVENDGGVGGGFSGGEEADAGGGGEDFFDRRGEGDGDEPGHGEQCNPHAAGSVHFYEDRGADAQRNNSEELIGDAK